MILTGANGSDPHVIIETNLELKVKESPKNRIQGIVAKDLNKPFILSVGALKKLLIISPDIPAVFDFIKVGETNTIARLMYKGSDVADCGCLKRLAVPDPPMRPPCELKMENRKKLERSIVDYFARSVFNKCEDQQLPVLSGEPMQILIDQTHSKPPAANKLASIPRAWEKQVHDDIKSAK